MLCCYRLYFVDSVFQSLMNECFVPCIYHMHDPLQLYLGVCCVILRKSLRSAFSSSSCVYRGWSGEAESDGVECVGGHRPRYLSLNSRIFGSWNARYQRRNLCLAPERLPLASVQVRHLVVDILSLVAYARNMYLCGRIQMPWV